MDIILGLHLDLHVLKYFNKNIVKEVAADANMVASYFTVVPPDTAVVALDIVAQNNTFEKSILASTGFPLRSTCWRSYIMLYPF